MALVRYVPGFKPDWTWDEVWVDVPDDGTVPHKYHYRGYDRPFRESLASLVARGAWQRAPDADLEMDAGL